MHATVRTFRAPDAAGALEAVKAALGPEAVILATREVGGGLFRRPEIEVTAALTEEPAKPAPAKPRRDQDEDQDQDQSGDERPARRGYGPREPRESRNEPREQRTRDEDLPEPRRLRPAASSNSNSVLAADLGALKRELDEARREMRVVCLRSRAERDLDLNPAAAEVFGRLVNQGVEEGLAEEMVRQALFDGARPQTLLSGVRDLVAGRLIPGRAPWMPDSRRVLALVGPTGVGKTTTVAKIAAKAIVESRLKVSLITVDTYRIGASEQIARYGSIMRVPTFVARDREELAVAMEKSKDADLVLIDTAGRAVSEAVARQAELLRSVPGVQLYLVLSAATGCRELAAAADRYRRLAPERVIFSKVDEAIAPGSVLSAAVRINRPVACIADGQRVPEDAHAVTSDELTQLVLGAWEPAVGQTARRS